MTRTDNDTWDLATSVGATATGVAVGRALASRAANPLINDPFAEPLVRAVGVDFFTRLASGELNPAEVDDNGEWGMQRMRDMMAVRTRFFDDFFIEATNRRNPPGGDPGVGAGCPCLPSGLAGRDHGLRDRPTRGHRVQDHDAGRSGRQPHRRPALGGYRSAPRLADRVARRRPGPDPTHRVERGGLDAVPAAGCPGCAAGQHHHAERGGQSIGHRERAGRQPGGADDGRSDAAGHRTLARPRIRRGDDRPCGMAATATMWSTIWAATAGTSRPSALPICLPLKAFRSRRTTTKKRRCSPGSAT